MSAMQNIPSKAPIHNVPTGRIVAVEHPCIVRNFDNGFKSLGGEAQLKHVSMCCDEKHDKYLIQR